MIKIIDYSKLSQDTTVRKIVHNIYSVSKQIIFFTIIENTITRIKNKRIILTAQVNHQYQYLYKSLDSERIETIFIEISPHFQSIYHSSKKSHLFPVRPVTRTE